MSALQVVKNTTLKDLSSPLASSNLLMASREMDTPDYTKQGVVCGGSTISFTDRLRGQQKRDVLNSTLFAQLASDYQYSREEPKWYNYYVDILGTLGYTMQGFDFTRYNSSGQTFTMDPAVLEILAAIATEDEMAIVKETLDAFKALQNDKGQVVLFDHYSKHLTNGGYQVFPCTVDSNNDVVLRVGGFYFNSRQDGVKILFFSYGSSSTSMYRASVSSVLNLDVYDQVREAVIDKLGDNARKAVLDIPLKFKR